MDSFFLIDVITIYLIAPVTVVPDSTSHDNDVHVATEPVSILPDSISPDIVDPDADNVALFFLIRAVFRPVSLSNVSANSSFCNRKNTNPMRKIIVVITIIEITLFIRWDII
jgi:hypothetical protein